MIDSLIQFLEVNIIPLGTFGVIIAAFIEEMIAPLPSPVVMTVSGFFLLEGEMSLSLMGQAIFLVGIPYAVGMLAASLIIFFFASLFGKPLIDRWGWVLGISWSSVEELNRKLKGTSLDLWTLFTLRVIPLVPSVAIAVFCGAIRMNIVVYVLITFVGVTIRASLFSLVGWYAGVQYMEYVETISRYENILLVVVFITLLVIIPFYYFRSRKVDNSHP